jgi:hypothetical protein
MSSTFAKLVTGGASAAWGGFRPKIFSREAAKNAKEKAFYGFTALLLEEDSSATEFRPLRVLCGFA